TLEIVPIYFLRSAYKSNYVIFNISGYENVKNEGWGNTLYIYPFYDYSQDSGQALNYGAYPGQPVIKYGGQFYTQIPTTTNGESGGASIKGVTINNGYWDFLHRYLEGWSTTIENNDTPNPQKKYHHQTYDFDDFYKLYKENGSNLNSVYFTFKYEEADLHRTNKPTDSSSTDSSYYRHDDIPNTLTQEQINAYDSKNGFEDYINSNGKKVDLFGEVLTGSELTADPIYVISQGYEYNNSGSFATEWVVFYWDSSNNRYQKVTENTTNFTSIVPSALHIRDYEHITTNYPAMNDDLPITVFENIYRALEDYKDRPVKICYERDEKGGYYNRPKGSGRDSGYDEAYRCDGIWSSTLKTDYVSANTVIEYSDDNGASWREDAFSGSTPTGSNTKCKAYFTYLNNSKNGYGAAYDGTTSISNVLVDDTKFFTFRADSAGQYEFVGWTLRDSAGNEASIKADSNNASETKMSTSVTLVARFKKVSSGSVVISHSLDADSVGLGTTYLGIKILDSSDTLVETIADEATNTAAKTIGKTYIKSDSTYKIQVVLKTVISGENTFNKFQLSKDGAENTNSDSTFLPTGAPTGTTTKTKTITFPINSLFSGTNQTLTSLSYFSLLNETIHKYEVKYIYTDRTGASKSMKVKGTFNNGQMNAYVTGSGSSKTVSSAFFNEIKPKVGNFKSDITFDFAAAQTASTTSWTGPVENVYTLTTTVSSTLSPSLDRTVTFKTPYEMTNYVATAGTGDYEGTYQYLADAVESEPLTVQYGQLVKITNGAYNLTNGSFVTAPRTLLEKKTEPEEDVVHYFKCWTIKTSSGATVASCYYPEFNYITYDNCIVEAEYSTDNKNYFEYFNEAKGATATFLKNTRTQWNVDASTSPQQADLIYSDFALSFKNGDVKFYEDGWSSDYEAGIVLQRLDAVEMDSDGKHTKTLSQYESQYSSTLTSAKNDILTNINSLNSISGIPTRKTAFTYNKFDNKNRLEYYVGQYNSKSWDETKQKWVYSEWDNENGEWTSGQNASKYVYRLFTYIYDKNDSSKSVISEPAYFYLYNTVND
ncbi:MAG: hypothetical protein IIU14_02870, partial [Ruminococcus sp.]|nr:hypothetical protein [Ruminococcus sp.]